MCYQLRMDKEKINLKKKKNPKRRRNRGGVADKYSKFLNNINLTCPPIFLSS